ncbi:hypothetical protein EVAR_93280_1 [Eumeta japonica]|uniref:Reverse transcriptase domain-containing protein n=1 Tax=Eumeta variegata TaxID=151549 RepID=A0A4C1TXX7_EUMVA|nr:hypothetical protein EVAR_93280_1 [Eumeta japonica]
MLGSEAYLVTYSPIISQIVFNELESEIGQVMNWMTYGVLQGSVLGPTLFLIYINKLCQLKFKQGRIFSFADDTALVFTSKTWEETYGHAQEELSDEEDMPKEDYKSDSEIEGHNESPLQWLLQSSIFVWLFI